VGPERVARGLGDPSPVQRAAAASVANATERDRLAVLVQSDPAAEVRSAALRRLVHLEGPGALEALLAAFSDREASVRNEAAQLAAGLGGDAVPRLREVALGWPDPAPETAVLALRFSTASDAQQVLRELADAHPDPRVRSLAALAIGRALGHAD
jgi:HEAT repeat protein